MSMAKKIEPEDKYIIKTDKSLEENTLRYLASGFVTGVILSGFTLGKAFETTPILVLAGKSLFSYAIPGGVAAAIFASTTCVLDDMRGKKHVASNAAVGGALAGMFLGSRSLKPWMCLKSSLAFGAFAGVLRYCVTYEQYYRKLDIVGKSEAQKLKEELYMSRYEHLRPKA